MPDTTPTVPPQLGQKCPRGHDYAQRSETGPSGLVMVVFCPACEPIDAAAEPKEG